MGMPLKSLIQMTTASASAPTQEHRTAFQWGGTVAAMEKVVKAHFTSCHISLHMFPNSALQDSPWAIRTLGSLSCSCSSPLLPSRFSCISVSLIRHHSGLAGH
ncbi:uncharacterized protein LOC111409192 isoform X2 [Olea europaea var. sylvestris]|uniref:uncharacterized protein LOC111409192 isoform X2 n=1 Tax=Olea europaea var. sylvestris TaxID=158386 RepID=UPI000C1D5343|nr:uncharacterized protein LOC111409192 isoform X2 [Olea europaea var. sylvestris]